MKTILTWLTAFKTQGVVYGGIILSVVVGFFTTYFKGKANQKEKHRTEQLEEHVKELEEVQDNLKKDKKYDEDINSSDNPRDAIIDQLHRDGKINEED